MDPKEISRGEVVGKREGLVGRRCVTKDWMGKWRLIGSEGDEARRLGWKRDELGRIDGKEII